METKRSSFSSEMEVAKLSAPPNLEVRSVSCNESAIKWWLSLELEETVFSLTHELFMTGEASYRRNPLPNRLAVFHCNKAKTSSEFIQLGFISS